MYKLLFYTKHNFKNPNGGREKLSSLLYETLKNIFKSNFYCISIFKDKSSWFDIIYKNYIDNVNNKNLSNLKQFIIKNQIDVILIDGSNLGAVAEYLIINRIKIKIIVFFHNFETIFFLESFYYNKTLKSFLIYLYNKKAEKKSLVNSNNIICLSKIDKEKILNKGFKKNIEVIPMCVKDQYDENNKILNDKKIIKNYILFVGTDFYANIHGLKWFFTNVSPFIKFETYVIGKNINKLQKGFKNKKIKFFGYQSDLTEFYLNASAVVSPIFKGSGMETKIAEALMFGKIIIATDKSLRGYENLDSKKCIRANNKSQFIESINNIGIYSHKKFENSARLTYKNYYSENIFQNKLKKFLFNEIYSHNSKI